MNYRSLIGLSVAVVGVMAGVAAAALARLPEGTKLPVHWNAAGVSDRLASAPVALFMPVAICAGVAALLAIVPHVEPLQRKLERSMPLFTTAWAGVLALMAVVEVQVAAPAFGTILPASLLLVATGILLIVVGNVLPKSRPGYFVGIRTPWTLSDPGNWIATHRLGSRTMMAGGAVIVAAAVLPLSPELRAASVVAALVLAVVPPLIYSFVYWRSHAAAD